MTQPALSGQIQSLETEVGARLFERDRQGTRLTPAGDQFRKDAGSCWSSPSRRSAGHGRRQCRRACSASVSCPASRFTPIIRESVLTGRPYNNRFASIVTVKDRKVTRWRDYHDPIAVFDASGWPTTGKRHAGPTA
jgi:hypothetical protein